MTTTEEHHGLGHLLVEDHEVAWRLALLLWAVAGFLLVAVAIPPLREVVFAVDEWFYETSYPTKIGAITVLAWVLNFLGGGVFAWVLRIFVTAVLVAKRRWESVAAWSLAIALSEPISWILKHLYGRERPPEALLEATSGSFPSGHSVTGAVVAVGLVIVLVPAGAERRNLEILAAGFAFIMGGSRIYLGAHYLADVIAGVAVGAAAAIGSAVVVHRFFLRRVKRLREEMYRRLAAEGTSVPPP